MGPPWPGGVPSEEYTRAREARDAFATRIDHLRQELSQYQSAHSRQEMEMRRLECIAWVAWHDEHGWPPGEEDYRARLRTAAGVASYVPPVDR